MTIRTPAQALAAIEAKAHARSDIGTGMCQANAHNIYLIGARDASALLAWQHAQFRHTDLSQAPLGAFIYMDGGHTLVQGQPAGHVVINAGNGKVWTPGGPADQNHWYLTTLAEITRGWPWHHYVGWTEDICGVRVAGLAPKSDKPKVVKPSPTPNVDQAYRATEKALKHNKDAKKPLRRVLKVLKRLSTKY